MKLNKCSFCGSNQTATMEVDRKFTGTYRYESSFSVECLKCGARGSKTDDRDKAITVWNNLKTGNNE